MHYNRKYPCYEPVKEIILSQEECLKYAESGGYISVLKVNNNNPDLNPEINTIIQDNCEKYAENIQNEPNTNIIPNIYEKKAENIQEKISIPNIYENKAENITETKASLLTVNEPANEPINEPANETINEPVNEVTNEPLKPTLIKTEITSNISVKNEPEFNDIKQTENKEIKTAVINDKIKPDKKQKKMENEKPKSIIINHVNHSQTRSIKRVKINDDFLKPTLKIEEPILIKLDRFKFSNQTNMERVLNGTSKNDDRTSSSILNNEPKKVVVKEEKEEIPDEQVPLKTEKRFASGSYRSSLFRNLMG